MKWMLSWRADPIARAIADRHYSRQSHGAKQFVPPGRCLVLLTSGADALWVTSYPFAEYTKHAWAGAWICSCFRNEAPEKYLSSELIVQAVAATRYTFGTPPDNGMVTFVNVDKTRKKRDPGRCFIRAGFKRVGYTKGGLVALQMVGADMPDPAPPLPIQADLFGDK